MEKFIKKATIIKPQQIEEPQTDKPPITENELTYLNSLSPKEKQAYNIAESHLKTSFELKRSTGYIDFNLSL